MENTLQIQVCNAPNQSVYPQKADFTFYGSLYRAVNFIDAPAAHFALEPDGTLGNPLRGASRHQDRRGVGNAITWEMMEEDMDILLELWPTSVRLAHYQHDQYFYDLCDRKGILIWAEIPYITKHMPEGNENTVQQMQELITQYRRHLFIICWALSNEICVAGLTDDLLQNHVTLNNLAHRLDPPGLPLWRTLLCWNRKAPSMTFLACWRTIYNDHLRF